LVPQFPLQHGQSIIVITGSEKGKSLKSYLLTNNVADGRMPPKTTETKCPHQHLLLVAISKND